MFWYGISEFRWWRLSQCPLRDYKDIMLGVWTAIKTASEVAEEVGWKRVIQRELGVSERVSVWCFWRGFVLFFGGFRFSGVLKFLTC